jgi:hypothetical protein
VISTESIMKIPDTWTIPEKVTPNLSIPVAGPGQWSDADKALKAYLSGFR